MIAAPPREAAKLAWIAPRRSQHVSDVLAQVHAGTYQLHDVINRTTMPFDELSHVSLVAMEVPPMTKRDYEHEVLKFVLATRKVGPHVAILVQPSLRRRTQHALWVQKWNRMPEAPFKFVQTCSCQLGNAVPGCHLTYFIGTSYGKVYKACNCVPTQSATIPALTQGLKGA